MKILKLKFIAGKYEGGEFRLPTDGEVVIGRGADLPVVLVEDMVSRRHAKLTIGPDRMTIEDLGSTNGTFVNGERIKKVPVREGDRILVGTSIMKLVGVDVSEAKPIRPSGHSPSPTIPKAIASPRSVATVPPPADPPTGQRDLRTSTGTIKTVAGSIEEIPIPDILQLFATSKKTGLMVLKGPGNQKGRIHIENGRLVHASLDGAPKAVSKKSLYRMLRWKKGSFELRPAVEIPKENRLEEGIEHLLMDGLREFDEIERLRPDLPNEDALLRLAKPLKAKLRELLPSTLDILELVHNEGQLCKVMDAAEGLSDLDVSMEVVLLIQKGYVVVGA